MRIPSEYDDETPGQCSQQKVILSLRGYLTMSGEKLLSQLGQWGECYCHLVERGQRCWSMSSNAQDKPLQIIIRPKMSGVPR